MFSLHREAWLSSVVARLLRRTDDSRSWTVRCRDEQGRSATTVVALTEQCVIVESADHETIHLSAAQVDRLRVALRAAVISLGGLEDDETCAGPAHVIPVQRSSGLPRAAGHSNE
jgi:hypothetical protein